MQALVDEWRERIRTAAAAKRALRIRGSGAKDFYGEAATGEVLDTRGYHGVLEYEPTELVICARAGTPLDAIEAELAARGQMLGFEPPHFGPGATLGGVIACGLSGPRRSTAGAVRDFVLGIRILDGRGEDLAFGGKVMKNVAGYDASRLMVGAMGTLGVVLEVSLKVLPRPECERTLQFECTQGEALQRLNAWAAKPYPISASCHEGDRLTLRLSGSAVGVEAIARRLGGTPLPEGDRFWQALREQRIGFFADEEPLWRLAVKSTAPTLPLPGPHLIEWNGALRWSKTRTDAIVIRDVARKTGGHATLFRAAEKTVPVFQPLPAPLMALHQRLKQSFDPAGILNPGRLYPEL
jgi:glycolate oxidase FAD binding subunit